MPTAFVAYSWYHHASTLSGQFLLLPLSWGQLQSLSKTTVVLPAIGWTTTLTVVPSSSWSADLGSNHHHFLVVGPKSGTFSPCWANRLGQRYQFHRWNRGSAIGLRLHSEWLYFSSPCTPDSIVGKSSSEECLLGGDTCRNSVDVDQSPWLDSLPIGLPSIDLERLLLTRKETRRIVVAWWKRKARSVSFGHGDGGAVRSHYFACVCLPVSKIRRADESRRSTNNVLGNEPMEWNGMEWKWRQWSVFVKE